MQNVTLGAAESFTLHTPHFSLYRLPPALRATPLINAGGEGAAEDSTHNFQLSIIKGVCRVGRPGMMVYFDMLESVECLSERDKGRLFMGMLRYGRDGIDPKFEGTPKAIWGLMKSRIDRDTAEYYRSVQRRRYAVFCRERKRKGESEVRFEEWLAMTEGRSAVINDDQCYPTTNTTANTNTNSNSNTAAAAFAATAAQRELKKMGGALGKGVVLLSDAQIEDLLDKLGLDAFDHYVDKLSDFILRNDARVTNHYDTILRWWRRDSVLER